MNSNVVLLITDDAKWWKLTNMFHFFSCFFNRSPFKWKAYLIFCILHTQDPSKNFLFTLRENKRFLSSRQWQNKTIKWSCKRFQAAGNRIEMFTSRFKNAKTGHYQFVEAHQISYITSKAARQNPNKGRQHGNDFRNLFVLSALPCVGFEFMNFHFRLTLTHVVFFYIDSPRTTSTSC